MHIRLCRILGEGGGGVSYKNSTSLKSSGSRGIHTEVQQNLALTTLHLIERLTLVCSGGEQLGVGALVQIMVLGSGGDISRGGATIVVELTVGGVGEQVRTPATLVGDDGRSH